MTANAPHLLEGYAEAWRPPRELSLSQWADAHFYLSAESAAEPGKWTTLPYQRGIMDAITDPAIEQISVMKSARVGFTKLVNATIGYYMHQDPCPVMVVQPTVEDAEGYSKEEIAPMLRDVPVLAAMFGEQKARASGTTILDKRFPGGSLSMVGANSGRGFRRVSRRVVLFDEVDGYPASAGSEGDQIKLGIRRTEYYWNRKIIAGSTPLIAGASRIERLFEAGDQRRYYVPCPQCGHMDVLCFRARADGSGHTMKWPESEPRAAYFVCGANGCVIEERDKRRMLDAGEWRAENATEANARHASFHLWAAYSVSPNASWGAIAEEFVDAKNKGPAVLQTVVNTVLGETWKERGEAPDWERLYLRRDTYQIGTAPAGVELVTAGVDVQADRLVYEVVGWGKDKRSWSLDAGVLPGDTAKEATWQQLDELLGRAFVGPGGRQHTIALMAVDSGYNTQQVYGWCRRYPMTRVIAVKGTNESRLLVGAPRPVEIQANGKRMQRGYRMWPVGGPVAKAELYGFLRLEVPEPGEPPPPGWCAFPEHGKEYFLQLTSEHLVATRHRNGTTTLEWQQIAGRENHWLDCRVYARAAAQLKGLDRVAAQEAAKASPPAQAQPPLQPPKREAPAEPSGQAPAQQVRGGWIQRGGAARRQGGWIGRKR